MQVQIRRLMDAYVEVPDDATEEQVKEAANALTDGEFSLNAVEVSQMPQGDVIYNW
jgi:hypothetical protein